MAEGVKLGIWRCAVADKVQEPVEKLGMLWLARSCFLTISRGLYTVIFHSPSTLPRSFPVGHPRSLSAGRSSGAQQQRPP
jgi:hypothetical protein